MKRRSLIKVVNNRVMLLMTSISLILTTTGMYFMYKEIIASSEAIARNGLANGVMMVEKMLNKQYVLVEQVEQSLKMCVEAGDKPTRSEVKDYLKEVLQSSAHAYGIFVAFEPNAYDGKDQDFIDAEYHDKTGRLAIYATRETIEALKDYNSHDYYQIPYRTKEPFISNPFSL